MKIKCTCGRWHELSATALAIVVNAFQELDLIRITGQRSGVSVHTDCIAEAFTSDRVRHFANTYKGNRITVDGADVRPHRKQRPAQERERESRGPTDTSDGTTRGDDSGSDIRGE